MTNTTPSRQSTAVRSLLWIVLTITAVGNATVSAMGLNPVVGVALGVATLASGVGLVVQYRRNR
jgi:hypothetical protein